MCSSYCYELLLGATDATLENKEYLYWHDSVKQHRLCNSIPWSQDKETRRGLLIQSHGYDEPLTLNCRRVQTRFLCGMSIQLFWDSRLVSKIQTLCPAFRSVHLLLLSRAIMTLSEWLIDRWLGLHFVKTPARSLEDSTQRRYKKIQSLLIASGLNQL